MEDSTLYVIAGLGLAGVLAWKYMDSPLATPVVPIVASNGLAPVLPSQSAQVAQQSQVATGVQTITVVPAPASSMSLALPAAVAPLVTGSVTSQGVYSGTPGVYFPVGNNYTAAEKQRIIADQTGQLSVNLPSIIPVGQAAALLQLPQSFLDGMKMGSSIGTKFGTFSLQPAGFVSLDKVDIMMEQALVRDHGSQSWAQYRAAMGLSGLGSFIRSNY